MSENQRLMIMYKHKGGYGLFKDWEIQLFYEFHYCILMLG